jgi:glutamine amidotransferase
MQFRASAETLKVPLTMCQLLGMNCCPTDATFGFADLLARRPGPSARRRLGHCLLKGAGDDLGLRHFVDHQPACSSPVAELISRYRSKAANVIAHP